MYLETGEIMYIVFYSTSNVFRAEELLNNENIECKVVPTPVLDKAYCGVCIETHNEKARNLMYDMEYEILEQN